ncbi:ABC transporter ATP-binding protein [Pontibacter sp. G13]|uniref:ABC transporter ATP-binding protein n=1 Tax=Pontibacter sp. G13 TaxID=3074898 RepID=UPI00288935CE|nr:ABC transporter ATP-binding protein [Pontibacter sp. G13]WNJ20953.1 ABC transporter ATP-binding protein [Pontibacter sp. G13]
MRIFKSSAKSQAPGGSLSFKENLAALKHVPPFLKMIWATHKGMTFWNITLRVLQAGIPVTTLYIGKLIIDEIVRLYELGGGEKDYLWMLVAIELGLALINAALSRGISLLDALLGDLYSNKVSVQLMEHAANMDLPQFEHAEFYDKLERARRQTTNRVVMLSQILKQVQDIITMTFLAAGLVVFNPWLILLLVLAVIPAFISETHFNQKSYGLARNWTPQRRELDYLRYIGASDNTAKEVKIFGLEDFLKDRFSNLADQYYEENKRLSKSRAFWGFVFNSLGDLGYYAAYIVIILQTISGTISLGSLTFLTGSFSRLRGLLRGILSRFSTIAQSALYLQDLFDFLDMKPEIHSPESPLPFPNPIQSGFTFERVSFQYPGTDKYAIQDLSFHLQAGEKLALVGENGAGKTTLVKLLARLYDPSEGRILLDGKDLREYDLAELRQAIGVIFQDYVRFQFTVSDNIAVGQINERKNHPMIDHAAEKSLAKPVIESLPAGYDQMLGKRFSKGMELSGGQWQKVALGRAYMRSAQLLILDEPTAALDARAEYEVFERFSELTQDKMAVLISHRFSTVRMADRILVMTGGKMEEMGSHEELLAKGGLYAELFELQAQGYK